MPTTAADREDLTRQTDDACTLQPPPDTATHDLAELWQDIGGSD
jgi:hypothetical protein